MEGVFAGEVPSSPGGNDARNPILLSIGFSFNQKQNPQVLEQLAA